MKQCPRCRKTYNDENLNYCLDDGEMLSGFVQPAAFDWAQDDSPPTVMLDEARRTNPTNWPAPPVAAPPLQYQQPIMASPQQFTPYLVTPSPNQTLAIVSLGLGIGSLTIGWCCSIGLLLGPAALITGFIALSQIKKDPGKYTGRGLAIGGIATGVVFFVLYVCLLAFGILASIIGK